MKQHGIKKMQRLYEHWQSSGLTKVAFCRQNGIVSSTFHYWIKKFRQQELPLSGSVRKGFLQIPVQPPVVAQDQQVVVVINFPSGVRVELFSPVEASFLKDLQ